MPPPQTWSYSCPASAVSTPRLPLAPLLFPRSFLFLSCHLNGVLGGDEIDQCPFPLLVLQSCCALCLGCLQWSRPELTIMSGPSLGLCPQESALNYSIFIFVLYIPRRLPSNKYDRIHSCILPWPPRRCSMLFLSFSDAPAP